MSDTAVDTSSEITTKDLKEKKEVVEEAENGRDAPANGNAVRKRMEMKMRRLRQLQANGQLKMMRMMTLTPRSRRPMRMTRQQKKEKFKGLRDLFTLHFPSQNLNVVTFE
ncbi:prothymosin alpha isoform X3 [Myotis daubentonii]|uniref:prothymosin alpha isoform X3 n=1 Tax=Myotis daubentonii TaxID=98922 RepID=UPI00287368EF|nr:prothymosin alpha isoform X3 [Myotis daubentonii]